MVEQSSIRHLPLEGLRARLYSCDRADGGSITSLYAECLKMTKAAVPMDLASTAIDDLRPVAIAKDLSIGGVAPKALFAFWWSAFDSWSAFDRPPSSLPCVASS
jgi:hypothetical protein